MYTLFVSSNSLVADEERHVNISGNWTWYSKKNNQILSTGELILREENGEKVSGTRKSNVVPKTGINNSQVSNQNTYKLTGHKEGKYGIILEEDRNDFFQIEVIQS